MLCVARHIFADGENYIKLKKKEKKRACTKTYTKDSRYKTKRRGNVFIRTISSHIPTPAGPFPSDHERIVFRAYKEPTAFFGVFWFLFSVSLHFFFLLSRCFFNGRFIVVDVVVLFFLFFTVNRV